MQKLISQLGVLFVVTEFRTHASGVCGPDALAYVEINNFLNSPTPLLFLVRIRTAEGLRNSAVDRRIGD